MAPSDSKPHTNVYGIKFTESIRSSQGYNFPSTTLSTLVVRFVSFLAGPHSHHDELCYDGYGSHG